MSDAPFPRRLEVEADEAHLPAVHEFADAAAAAAGFSERDRYAIRSAAGEAVTHAIERGSAGGHPVRIEAALEGDELVFTVRDNGTFIPRVSPRGDLGRGMALMGELMDEVELRPTREGTVLRLVKRLRRPPG